MTMLLGKLKKGQKGLIVRIRREGSLSPEFNSFSQIEERLMEMGLLEGSLVEVVHEAPFGGDPFAVRVRGSLVALQRQFANLIEVFCDEPKSH